MESILSCIGNPSLATAPMKSTANTSVASDAFSALFSQALGISPIAVGDGILLPADPDAPPKRSTTEEDGLAAICLPLVLSPAPQGQPLLPPVQATAAVDGIPDAQGQSAILPAVKTISLAAPAFAMIDGSQVQPSLSPSNSIAATTAGPTVADNRETEPRGAVATASPQIRVPAEAQAENASLTDSMLSLPVAETPESGSQPAPTLAAAPADPDPAAAPPAPDPVAPTGSTPNTMIQPERGPGQPTLLTTRPPITPSEGGTDIGPASGPEIAPPPLARQTPGMRLEAVISRPSGGLAKQIEQWLGTPEVAASTEAPTSRPEPSFKPSSIRSQRTIPGPGSRPTVMQAPLKEDPQGPSNVRPPVLPQPVHHSPKVIAASYVPSDHQGSTAGQQPDSPPESAGDAVTSGLAPETMPPAHREALIGRGHGATSTAPSHGQAPVWQPQLVNEIASRIRLLGGPQGNSIEVHLEVAQLGRIGLSAVEKDDEMKLKLFTDNGQIQNAIETHLPQIKAALAEQGIRVGHFAVEGSHDTGGGFIAGNPQHGQGHQTGQQPRHIFRGWADAPSAEEAPPQSWPPEPAKATIIDYRA